MTDRWTQTQDGSLTLRDSETGELYHNRAGAYTEAFEHYALPSSALQVLKKTGRLKLLDVCFGLGYNTFALLAHCIRWAKSDPQAGNQPFDIQVIAVENNRNLLADLPVILKDPRLSPLKSISAALEHNIYYQTLESPLRITIAVAGNQKIHLEFFIKDLRSVVPTLCDPIDLVFHDPFSPAGVPELWTLDLFRHYHRLLQPQNGMLITYSSAVAVRGGLRQAGFFLGKTPPLGQKTGGTLAFTQAPAPGAFVGNPYWLPLSDDETALLGTRSALPYQDPDFSTGRDAILDAREAAIAASILPRRREIPLTQPDGILKSP